MSFRRTVVLSLLLAGGLACGSSEPKQTPTAISLASSSSLTGVVGQPLTPSPEIVVKDQNGNPIAGIPLTITVSAGGGTIAGVATTTTSGSTPIGTLTLGTVAGAATITVNAAGLTPLVITVTAVAGPPAALAVLSGDKQSAFAGTRVGPIQLVLKDQFGNKAVGTAPATFSVVSGSGVLTATTATPDANGIITVPAWELGKLALPQAIRATVGTFSVDITATVQSQFNVEVRFFGAPMTPAQQALFTNAAARISAIITGDIIAVRTGSVNLADFCQIPGLPTIDEVIDDVVIYASMEPIDGPGKVLGQAFPCGTRSASSRFLPVIGVMQFDAADQATLSQDVITHEMLHVVGFGTLWGTSTNAFVTGAKTVNSAYVGPAGIQGCRDVGGVTTCATSVPLENDGGPNNPKGEGTIDSHWREATFDTELMTGFAERSGLMPLSLMTIGALTDLGYTTNTAAADPYTIAIGSLRALRASSPDERTAWDVTELPGDGLIFERDGSHTRGAPVRKRTPVKAP